MSQLAIKNQVAIAVGFLVSVGGHLLHLETTVTET
jgi:hypothetical protein